MNPDTQKMIDDLSKRLTSLEEEFYRGNLPSFQEFTKSIVFRGRLKVTHYASLPSVAEIGEIAETGGKLYICSATNTWALVGTQT